MTRAASLAALLLLVCVSCHAPASFAAPIQPPGRPVSVPATVGFNRNPTGIYSTGVRDFNAKLQDPALTVEWTLAYPRPRFSVVAVEAAMVPESQNEFIFLGRYESRRTPYPEYIAALVDLRGKTVQNVTSKSNLFCGHLVQTHDQKVLIVGGSGATPQFERGLNDIAIYDHKTSPLTTEKVATMAVGRWYPTATLLPDRTILIQGGSNGAFEAAPRSLIMERWDPRTPTRSPPQSYPIEAGYRAGMQTNFFPFQYLLPTGDVFIMQDHLIRFWNPTTGTYRTVAGVPEIERTYAFQWPRSGSFAATALSAANNYSEVSIVVMGGVPVSNQCRYGAPDNLIDASRKIARLRITWTINSRGEPTYRFPNRWEYEDMGIPRTGGDITVTPGGQMFLTSGSQKGCHGQTEYATMLTRNTRPAVWPILYQPDRPKDERVTVLMASQIVRVYHMVAALTLDGSIMVAGCDACNNHTRFIEGIDPRYRDTWWSPSGPRREFRTELFHTPYSRDINNRPEIVTVDGNGYDRRTTVKTYGNIVTITWRSAAAGVPLVPVDGVSLVAPAAATHSLNANQRVIKLEVVRTCRAGSTGTIVARMPPNANIAPPQSYMMFLMNKDTNSQARWLRMVDY